MGMFNTKAAYDYYDKHINRKERFDLLEEYNLSVAGSIPNIDWELLGAILTGDKGKKSYGSDLSMHEIKSAVSGNSFEYQYHLHGGEAKLNEDMTVDHIFISYSANYQNVVVRFVAGAELASIFEGWRPGLVLNYTGENRKQRYRKSIAYSTVVKKGQILMQIQDGRFAYVDEV